MNSGSVLLIFNSGFKNFKLTVLFSSLALA